MPTENIQEQFYSARKQLYDAMDELMFICKKYPELSEETKKQVEFLEDDIHSLSIMPDYKISHSLSYSKEKELQEIYEKKPIEASDYMRIYDKFAHARFEYLRLKRLLEHIDISDDVDFLDESPAGEIRSQEPYETSILNNYRSWGIKRIALDGFQNHLPADAKGTACYVHFMVDGKWVDADTARQNRDRITKIRFADDGVGFSSKNLKYLSSQKTSEDNSAGQFGEGLKLIAMACVNYGLDLEIQSQNWIARAYGKDATIDVYRTGEKVDEQYKQLTWDVTTYSGEPIKGSRTIFNSPNSELIDFTLNLQDYILQLREPSPYGENFWGTLVDTEKGGKAFVKGIYIKDIDSFFSYDFKTDAVNPDRNDFTRFNMSFKVAYLLRDTIIEQDPELAKKLIYKVLDYYSAKEEIGDIKDDPIECQVADYFLEYITDESSKDDRNQVYLKHLLKKYFDEYYAEKYKDGTKKGGVLQSQKLIPENIRAALNEYEVVRLPEKWTKLFLECGVPFDLGVVPDFYEEHIPTSLSIDYGAQIWDKQRILLDACQNHLPSDSGGKNIYVRFLTKDGIWQDYTEFEFYEDSEIKQIKISDDGMGYDYKSLGIFASTKDNSGSSGKWGEGLKMIAAASVRSGEHIKLVSRNWEATPSISEEVLNEGKENERKVQRLNFDVRVKTQKEENEQSPSLERGEVSATIFESPSSELISLFRRINENVLTFSDRKPFASVNGIDILDFSGGKVFVRNLLIPGDHQTKYTYHLKDLDIETRDRDAITAKTMKSKIFDFMYNVKDKTFIKLFLRDALDYAKDPEGKDFLEFTTKFIIPNESERSDAWIDAFQEYFGENACVRKMSDQNPTLIGQAEHVGLKTITLPDTIAESLLSIRTRDGRSLPSYEKLLEEAFSNEFAIPEGELTKEEKALVEQLYSYNKIFEANPGKKHLINKIMVYDYPPEYKGLRAAGHARYGHTICISRETLKRGLHYATDVYLHEYAHTKTGAKDTAPQFRDSITSDYASYVINTCPMVQSVMDNGLAKGIIASRFENFIRKIFQKLSFRRKSKDKEDDEREED